MNAPIIPLAAALACAALLCACGGSGAGHPEATEAGAAANGTASAPRAHDAEEAMDKPRCPAKTDPRLGGPDIVGVRLGMTREAALDVVRCHATDALVVFEDRWFERRDLDTHRTQLEKQLFIAQRGETSDCNFGSFQGMQRCGLGGRQWDHVAEKIKVATPGIAGGERVVGVWRAQHFKEGEMPSVESVTAALTGKYGAFQRESARTLNNNLWGRRIDLAWISGLDGAPLSEADPMFARCAGNVRASPDDGQVWTDGCGLGIAARIMTPRSNPDIVEQLSVGMMHQSDLFAFREGLQAQLESIERDQRGKELEQAESSEVQL